MKFRQMCIPVRKSEEEKKEEQQGYDPSHVSISFDADKRIIRVDGEIGEDDGIIFEEVIEAIRDYIPCDEEGNELQDRPEPLDRLEIHINSEGGSVDAALTIDVLRNFIKSTDKTWKIFEELVLENTKIDEKLLSKIYKNGEDFFIDSSEALKYGCVDKVL